MITAVRGLGDAMVAGTVTPDTYVVDKASRSTIGFEPGEDPAGPALDAADLAAVVDVALAVESGFGAPVDIEAAQSAGTWFLLQGPPDHGSGNGMSGEHTGGRNRAGRSSGATSSRSPSTIPRGRGVLGARRHAHAVCADPAAQDMFLRVTGAAFTPFFEMFGAPQRLLPKSLHGYAYFAYQKNVPDEREKEQDAWWTQVNRDRIPLTRALWDDEIRLSSEGCSRGWPPCRSTSYRTRRPPRAWEEAAEEASGLDPSLPRDHGSVPGARGPGRGLRVRDGPGSRCRGPRPRGWRPSRARGRGGGHRGPRRSSGRGRWRGAGSGDRGGCRRG